MTQSLMPAAMSCRTVSKSSADRIVAPFVRCLQRRKCHRQRDGPAGTIGPYARVSELADEMALGAIVLWAWGFESPLAHSVPHRFLHEGRDSRESTTPVQNSRFAHMSGVR